MLFIPVVTSAWLILIQVAASLEKNLLPRLSSSPPDIEALRLYLTLPECPLLSNPNNYTTLTIPFAKAVVSLKDAPIRVLGTSHLLWEEFCLLGFITPNNISVGLSCIIRWLGTERLYIKWSIFRLFFINGGHKYTSQTSLRLLLLPRKISRPVGPLHSRLVLFFEVKKQTSLQLHTCTQWPHLPNA